MSSPLARVTRAARAEARHQLLRLAGRIDALPLAARLTPKLNRPASAAQLAGFRGAQELATACVAATLAELRADWSERRTAAFMRAWLEDRGVRGYFHRPLVWFGARTRLTGFTSFRDLRPTAATLGENAPLVLDFAPVVSGFGCDFSHASARGEVPGYAAAQATLAALREAIPRWVDETRDGVEVWRRVNAATEAAGLVPLHRTSPYAFLGHRVHRTRGAPLAAGLVRVGAQTYHEFFARGVVGQLWTGVRRAPLTGLWAVEPHLGSPEGAPQPFGLKFEEILVVTKARSYWLADAAHEPAGRQ